MRTVLMVCLLALLVPTLSAATEYQFRTIDVPFPAGRDTNVTGLTDAGVSVGTYVQGDGTTNGFRLQRPRARFEVLPQLSPQVITNTELIAGFYGSPRQGFVLNEGTFRQVRPEEPSGDPLSPRAARLTEALAANDAGLTVGDFRSGLDDEFKGFVFDPSTGQIVIITIPGITALRLTAINNLGQLAAVGRDGGGQLRSLLGDRVTRDFTPVELADFPEIEVAGLTDDGVLAVNVGSVGAVVQHGVVQVIEMPGATATDLSGVRADLTVYGSYLDADGNAHGFIAVPDGTRIVPRRHSAGLHRPFTSADCMPGSKRLVCRGH